MPHKILVTGGAGYIGSHVVHALLDKGLSPIVLDNLSTGIRDFLPRDVPFVETNISDVNAVRGFLRKHACDSVIHLAGSVSVEESVHKPLRYYENNTCASHAFIKSCVAENVQNFIFSSSAAVYGNPGETIVSEDAQPNPVSPYGWSKLMTEKMLEGVCAVTPMNAISLRYFNVAGADTKGRCGMVAKNATHLIKALCETAVGTRPLFTIFGDDYDTPDGTCIRDFIHVNDLAEIHVAALEHLKKARVTRSLNCGYGHGFSVQQVVDTVLRLNAGPVNIKTGPRREGDIVALVADISNMRKYLNWEPLHDDLDTIVSSSLEWERRLRERKG